MPCQEQPQKQPPLLVVAPPQPLPHPALKWYVCPAWPSAAELGTGLVPSPLLKGRLLILLSVMSLHEGQPSDCMKGNSVSTAQLRSDYTMLAPAFLQFERKVLLSYRVCKHAAL